MRKTLYFSAFFIVFVCLSTKAQNEDKEDDPTRWTPKDIINTEYLGSPVFSVDGNLVVWSKRKGVKKEDKFVSDLYLTRLNDKKDSTFRTVQLTFGDDNDYNPVFGENNEDLYFLSSRDKGKKLWKLSIYGGEAKEVHEFKNGISALSRKDDNTLTFLSDDGKTLYEAEAEEKKDNVEVIEDSLHWKPNHVYAFDLKEKTITRLTDNEKTVTDYEISRDGNWLFYKLQRSLSYAADAQKDPYNYLKNLKTGKEQHILTDLEFPIGNVQFTADNGGFYFTSNFSNDPKWNGAGIDELYYFDLTSKKRTKIPLDWALGLGLGFEVAGNNVIATLANRATMRLAYYAKKGSSRKKSAIALGEKNDHTQIEAVSEDGSRVILAYSTASKLPKYYVADLKKGKMNNLEEFVELNKDLDKKSITKSEVMTWKGYKDEEVTGILYYPENYKEGKAYPLMLSIHGGPSSQDLDTWSERWSTYPNLLAQKGMFVLKPNYHGSANHGLNYVESIQGNYYEPELEDITKGIDKLVNEGKVDKNELGTMGWSNGAILTIMLTVKYPDMFKVAASGAGDVNWTSDFGTCQFGVSFDQHYFGGAPWDDKNGKPYNENYLVKSPIFEIEKIKTPTIIFHGSEDRAVPRDQGWEFYRGLQQVGQTPVMFLWFPGQPHGLGKITHQLRKMNAEITWIDTYLLDKPSTKNESFKEDSPLGHLLALQKAKSNDGIFGVMENGILVPETDPLKKDSIALGRFEVTNAQFKAFKPDFNYERSHENDPVVTDLTAAKAYTAWLSSKTGKIYRLPNAEEAEALHKKARKAAKDQNNLNHWAGYGLTVTDVPGLKKKLDSLQLSLIEPVGKHKPIKINGAEIYDLGGNVAEYSTEGVYGYSAYDFYDPFDDARVESEHVGFRVVRE